MKTCMLLFLVLLNYSFAESNAVNIKVIYGEDNRIDPVDSDNENFIKLAESTAAMISRNNLKELNSEQCLISGRSLSDRGICEEERFAAQPTAANCSGFLVAKNLLVTAGHCIKNEVTCKRWKWVFGYQVQSETDTEVAVDKKDVYSCKRLVSQELSNVNDMDYALIELDRDVEDREPLTFRRTGKAKVGDKLVVIGHPSGLPTKIADGAEIRNINNVFFQANLDTYGGNSGSAVFNAETGVVEGILVRGEQDYVYNRSRGCRVSKRFADDAGRGEDITIIMNVEGILDIPETDKPGEEVINENIDQLAFNVNAWIQNIFRSIFFG